MRALLPALLLVMLLIPAPARAQQPGVLMIAIPVSDAPLVPGHETTLDGVVSFIGDPRYEAWTGGIPVVYTVTKAPAWAHVALSPSEDVFYVGLEASPTVYGSRALQVHLAVDGNVSRALDNSMGRIEITAVAAAPIGATSPIGKWSSMVSLDASSVAPCDEPASGVGAGVVQAPRVPAESGPLGARVTLAFAQPNVTRPGAPTLVEERVTYWPDPRDAAQLGGVPVTLSVLHAPSWAEVELQPSNLVIPQGSGAPFAPTMMRVTAAITTSLDAPAANDAIFAPIEVLATAAPSVVSAAPMARADFLLPSIAPHACLVAASTEAPVLAKAISAPPLDGGTPRTTPITVQSASAVPVDSSLIVLGFAAAGATVGLVLRRRFA